MRHPAILRRSLIFAGLFLLAHQGDLAIGRRGSLAAQEESGAQIRLVESEDGKHAFEVSGLSPELLRKLARVAGDDALWSTSFAAYVAADRPIEDKRPPAIVGRYSVRDGVLRFQPRYPLEPGLSYRAVVRDSAIPATFAKEFKVAEPPASEPTEIAAVYPTSDRLPENQLKFYLHFSAPMSRGQAYDHLQLLDSRDRPIDLPFLELGEELWTPDGRRFTLLFDPGRIKRGLKPREEAGPVLEEGKTYTLVVNSEWQDAEGRSLAAGLRKTFSVDPPDDTPPDPGNWTLRPPRAGSRQPLEARFPEPLDQALLERLLNVETPEGDRMPGEVSIDEGETRWRFQPKDDSWRAGRYKLVVGKTLEDRAGNSIDRPFEIDEERTVTRRLSQEEVRLPFEVK